MKVILSIAGSDTSAGAGIQQDLKTITALGHYAATVPTALTAQNTMGVRRVMAVPEDMLRAQLDAVIEDMPVAAIKIGMIPNIEAARVIVNTIRRVSVPIVSDPVMISTSGTQLMSDECVDYISQELFPLCTLITPNIPEAERLFSQLTIGNGQRGMDKGQLLAEHFSCAVLLKGGHNEGDIMRDVLYTTDGTQHEYSSPRIASTNLHGTGCTLSSAIAALLGAGLSLPEAVEGGKRIINEGITKGRHLHVGKGNGPLWMF